MDINDLKCVVGKVEVNKPAFIRLFGSINEWNCANFNDEFKWLQDEKPSKIVVLINSEGGSCLHGMSVFSTIQSSEIPTECINEGLAASMASVIWVAGNSSYMRDYSILMIHNPFLEDENDSAVVKAFRQQLETIYCKRFGLAKDKVKCIMDGPAGEDGTYFSAQQAVDAGIIPAENIIKTSKQTRNKVKNQIDAAKDTLNIRKVMESVCAEMEENKLSQLSTPIRNQIELLENTENKTKMEEKNPEFDAIAAQLGFKNTVASITVLTKITELQKAEAKLADVEAKFDETTKELTALKITNKGNEANVLNLQKELDETKASLAVYESAKKAQQEAKITAMIDKAVQDGKIEESAKAQWVEMAHANLAMVESTIASIAGREKISAAIATDKANVEAAKDGAKTEQEKLAERVNAVIGNDFSFKKL